MNKTKEQNENEKTIVALYARKSTRDEEEQSVSAQLNEMRSYCEKKGWLIYDEFVDNAKTGTNDKREGFQELIYQALRGDPTPFHKIIVWKLSRFARNKDDSRIYKARLKKKGVIVHSMTQEAVNDDGVAGYIVESVYEAMDEQFSKELGEDIKRGYLQKAKKGSYPFGGPNTAPFGYRMETVKNGVDTLRKLVINKEEASIIQKIFEFCISGIGSYATVRMMNEKGFKTRAGNFWTTQTLLGILKNEKYTGCITVNGETFTNFHEPIISQEVFQKAQESRKAREPKGVKKKTRLTSSSYILSGLLVCGKCGKKMKGSHTTTTAKGKRYMSNIYLCSSYHLSGPMACDRISLNQSKIEISVKNILENHIFTEKNMVKMVKIMNRLRKRSVREDLTLRTSLVNQISTLKKEMRKLDEIILDGDNYKDKEFMLIYSKKVGDCSRAIKKCEFQLYKLDQASYVPISDKVALQTADQFKKSFHKTSFVLKKEFLRNFIERIEVTPADGKDKEINIVYKVPGLPDERVSSLNKSTLACS